MLLLAFGEGLHRQLSINQKGMGSNIVVMWPGQTSKAFEGLGKGRPIRFLAEDAEFLRQSIPEIGTIGYEDDRWGIQVIYKDRVLSEHVVGCTPEYEDMRNFIPQRGGRMINDLDMAERRRVAFLGWALASQLFDDNDPIGKVVMVSGVPFTVIGVMSEKIMMGNYGGMDSDHLVIPFTTFKAIFGGQYIDNMVFRATKPELTTAVKRRIFETLGARYRFDPTDDRAIAMWDTVESSREFQNMLIGIKMFLGIIGGLTLLIAGVGVANIMYVSIRERTREIGIKMAVGARRGLILTQFLLEALLITFIGGAVGIGVSYALTEAFKLIPMNPQTADVLEFMGRPTVSFEIGTAVVVILGILGLVAGLFPALRAASVSPVEALRYE
jgi:putative ABC transport system permease protein